MALVAAVYTAMGGLKSVALTDALQTVVMVIASVTLFFIAWNAVGGWSGLEQKLRSHQPGLERQLLHVGSDTMETQSTEGKQAAEIENLLLLGGVGRPFEQTPEVADILFAQAERDSKPRHRS